MTDDPASGADSAATPTEVLTRLVEEAAGVALGDEAQVLGRSDATAPADRPAVRLADSSADRPEDRLADLLAGDAAVVGVVPQVSASLARDVVDSVDGEVRLVLTGDAAARLEGPSGPVVRTALANRGVSVSVHDGDSPVGILLVGDRAVVGVFDGDGLAALLWTDAPAVRQWAADTYRRYVTAAESV